MDRKATDDIFGAVLARNEGALLSDDPAFPGAVSPEPLTQLEVVAQARQSSNADGHDHHYAHNAQVSGKRQHSDRSGSRSRAEFRSYAADCLC